MRSVGTCTPLQDFWPRAIGIPAFGVGIPLLFNLYGPVPAFSRVWWLGQAAFLALAFVLWHGNRWLLFATAGRFDWLERPWSRVGRLLLGIVLFTAPLTIVVSSTWYVLGRGEPVARSVVQGLVLTNIVCVVFVSHVYETVLLLKARADDLVKVAQSEQARVESQLLALRRQIDPHFLFNSLNTMSALLDEDPARARRFNEHLAAMLRYLLDTGERQLVAIDDELAFVGRYTELMSMRFGDAVHFDIERDATARGAVPPTSVQLLVENAIAHNCLSEAEPLHVRIEILGSRVTVGHSHRPRADSKGAGIGLANLAARLLLTSCGPLVRTQTGGRFIVSFPVAREPSP